MKGRKGDRGRRRTEAWEKGSGDWKQRRALAREETTFESLSRRARIHCHQRSLRHLCSIRDTHSQERSANKVRGPDGQQVSSCESNPLAMTALESNLAIMCI